MTTLTQQLLEGVNASPGLSACQWGARLGRPYEVVSSLLHRLVKRGDLSRTKGGGPRGGYTYTPQRKGEP
jgi:hypothetical protein